MRCLIQNTYSTSSTFAWATPGTSTAIPDWGQDVEETLRNCPVEVESRRINQC